ncbi:hypothetical protein ACFWU3_23080 [Streptomyces sp. NPDC058685]|uniref:hypothetical protein n=1 Tax=Streptomyces sp. NPDC058685 TaxID=3346598 RepID=UPI0036621B0A
MVITGGDTAAPGTALLIAAAPVGKGRLIDASSVLPALAAVPPSALTGTAAATVVELADPLDPQTVLTRIRAAAAAEGPVFLYIAGQLQLDRKQRLPHLALARSTPSTMRYTALPWHWLGAELMIRRPGTTTMVVDLVADAETWPRVAREGLGLGAGVHLYGRVAPPPQRGDAVGPAYLAACASIWRSGSRPTLAALHEQAALQAGVDGALLLAPAAGTPPHGATTGGGYVPLPHGTTEGNGFGTLPPAALPVAPPVPADGAYAPVTAVPYATAPAGGGGAPTDTRPAQLPVAPLVAAEAPAPLPPSPGTDPARLLPAQATGSTPPAPLTPSGPGAASLSDPADGGDPHPAILAAAHAGRHHEAAAAAASWEQQALRSHGPASPEALHWVEVRADLARLAGDPALSCELWMAAAETRLTRQQAADDPDVEGAVDRAHHQWEQIRDVARARALAPALVALRRRVPGRQRGALQVLQRRLEHLHAERPVGRGTA